MEDVSIPTSEPVKAKVAPAREKPPVAVPAGSFKNFFLMAPLALVLIFQGLYFGRLIGTYTTFPLLTLHSYLVLAAVGVLFLIIQMCVRSMVYSTLFGVALVSGVFGVWFGNFWDPVYSNFREMSHLLKSAWSHRDIPFPILITFMMTMVLGGTIMSSFFLSLIIKYFFEIVFGREWSDGRKFGFIGAIVLMLGVHFGFSIYLARDSKDSKIIWQSRSLYAPIEEFLTRVPSATQWNPNNLWDYDRNGIRGFSFKDQRWSKTLPATAAVLAPAWLRVDAPFVPEENGVTGFDRDVLKKVWHTPYPASLPNVDLDDPEVKKGQDPRRPVLVRAGATPDQVLFMFEYGVWGGFSLLKGEWQWVLNLDARVRANRVLLDDLFHPGYVVSFGDILVFALHNGKLVAIRAQTGERLWDYADKEAKFGGKSQRAYLTVQENRVLAAFPAGALVAIEGETGRVIHETRSMEWHPGDQPVWTGDEVEMFTESGWYYKIVLDGGKILEKRPFAENPLPLMPLLVDLTNGFIGYQATLEKIIPKPFSVEKALSFPNHIFSTRPIVADNLLYLGTQDGWTICLHAESYHEKWRVHARGELIYGSLLDHPAGIMVRTRSGSLLCLKKGA